MGETAVGLGVDKTSLEVGGGGRGCSGVLDFMGDWGRRFIHRGCRTEAYRRSVIVISGRIKYCNSVGISQSTRKIEAGYNMAVARVERPIRFNVGTFEKQ